jgi:hypothetical protein
MATLKRTSVKRKKTSSPKEGFKTKVQRNNELVLKLLGVYYPIY